MAAKKSQRTLTFLFVILIAVVYPLNFFVFDLPRGGHFVAGGLGMIALGMFWIYYLGTPETLSCNHTLGACRLVKPRFLHTPKQVLTFPLARLRGVRINETYVPSHDGAGRTGYEVSLETDDGRTHVFTTTNSKRSADALAARIKSFLKDETQRSLVLRRFPWTFDAMGAVFIFLGLLSVVGGMFG